MEESFNTTFIKSVTLELKHIHSDVMRTAADLTVLLIFYFLISKQNRHVC